MSYKSASPRPVEEGGTQEILFGAYSVILAGTDAQGPLQYANPGASGQLLISNGSGSPASFQMPPIPEMKFQLLSADPSDPQPGQVWYRTDTDVYKGLRGNFWTAKTSFSVANFGLAGAPAGSNALRFGGSTPATSATTELYSVGGDSWSAKTSLNTARNFLSGAALDSNNILSFGGFTGSDSAVTELYSVSGNTWTARTSMNTARNRLAGAMISSTDALSAGGSGPLSAVELYNLTGNTWTTKTSLNTATSGLTGMSIGGDVLVAGPNAQQYDTSGDSWTTKTAMNVLRTQAASASISATAPIVFGGSDGGSTWYASTEKFDVVGNSWSTESSMNTARVSLAGAALSSSTALSYGGYNGAGLTTTELYTDDTIVTFTVS